MKGLREATKTLRLAGPQAELLTEYQHCALLQQQYLQVGFLALYIPVSSLPLPRFLLLTTILSHFFVLEDKSFGHSLLLNYVSPVSCSLFHTFYSFLMLCLLVVVLISPSLLHSSSTRYNVFVSFSINLKEEIYFCRNFLSKAFESPSLVVTPPRVHFPFLLVVFFKFPGGPLSHHPSYTVSLFRCTSRAFELLKHRPELNKGEIRLLNPPLFSVFRLITLSIPSLVKLSSKLISSASSSIK